MKDNLDKITHKDYLYLKKRSKDPKVWAIKCFNCETNESCVNCILDEHNKYNIDWDSFIIYKTGYSTCLCRALYAVDYYMFTKLKEILDEK